MATRTSVSELTVTGDKEIDRKLKHLASSGQRRVARAGTSKMQTILLRGIRNAVPPNYKSAKKTLGRRNKKNKKTGEYESKIGFGVGKRTKSKVSRDPKKPGVGISKRNIHWLILGTKHSRAVGEGWLEQGIKSVEAEAIRAGQEVMREKVMQEVRKA